MPQDIRNVSTEDLINEIERRGYDLDHVGSVIRDTIERDSEPALCNCGACMEGCHNR